MVQGSQKKIAAINDLTGYGRCALTVSMPVISHMKIQCCPVPTSILSNHTGYEEYFFGQGVCMIEWAEIIKELLPKQVIYITIQKDYTKSECYRKIVIVGGQV